jgi:TRAP-type C4-dicarboxylate transport system substrate-binding protein
VNRRGFIQGTTMALLAGSMRSAFGNLASDVKIGMSTPASLENNGVFVWIKTCAGHLQRSGFGTRLYPNSTLGGDRERTYQMQLGLLDLNSTGGDEIGRWSPTIAAMAHPFVIESYDHMSRFISETPFIEQVSRELRPYGLELVDSAYTASMVGLFTRGTPVHTMDDLRQLRLRVLSEADFALLRAWDVRGVQVAWEEVAQGLQTGIIDAYLNPPNIALMFGHGSVLDYFTDLKMGPAGRLVVASTKWLDSLSPSERDEVDDAFAAARKANREWTRTTQSIDRQNVERAGIEWIEMDPGDRREWVEASAAIPAGDWETPEATARYLEWVEQTRRHEP